MPLVVCGHYPALEILGSESGRSGSPLLSRSLKRASLSEGFKQQKSSQTYVFWSFEGENWQKFLFLDLGYKVRESLCSLSISLCKLVNSVVPEIPWAVRP